MVRSIEYYRKGVEKSVFNLPSSLLTRYLRLTDLMIEFGSNLGMPDTRAITEGLLELSVKGKEGIARVFYCTIVHRRVVMLQALVQPGETL